MDENCTIGALKYMWAVPCVVTPGFLQEKNNPHLPSKHGRGSEFCSAT